MTGVSSIAGMENVPDDRTSTPLTGRGVEALSRALLFTGMEGTDL